MTPNNTRYIIRHADGVRYKAFDGWTEDSTAAMRWSSRARAERGAGWYDGAVVIEVPAPPEPLSAAQVELARLRAIIACIDAYAPRADLTTSEPGITLSEAARRQLRDEGHPLFVEDPAS